MRQEELEKKKEGFEYWLADMDDALERFLETMPENTRDELDLTRASLDILEAWVLKRYGDTRSLLGESEKEVLDGLARYVGETFRKELGGRWEIRVDDPKYVHFGLPQLSGFAARSTPISPHSLVTASADRRSGHYLRQVLENSERQIRGERP